MSWETFWPGLERDEPNAMSDATAINRAGLLATENPGVCLRASLCEGNGHAQWYVYIWFDRGWFRRRQDGEGYGYRFGQAYENALADFKACRR